MRNESSWRLEVLGQVRLVHTDGRAVRLDGTTLALVTYVALEGPTARSRLAGLLWPDTVESAARNNLVHVIRRLARSCGEPVLRTADVVGLTDDVRVDARELDERTPTDMPLGALLENVEFDAHPDLSDWLLAWRERLDDQRADHLARWAATYEQDGDLTLATRAAQRLLDLNPVSEDAYRRLMRLHYLDGDRGAALAAFERCKDMLRREFGSEPLPETLHLAREVERGEASVTARDARVAMPLSVLRPPSLVGRDAEWRDLHAAWTAGQVIVLLGEGGVGKSRLARDFANTMGEVMPLEGRPGDASVPYLTLTRGVRRVLARTPDLPLEPWMRAALAP
ncbi:BTAD domain-containing putative transcriptional regulator, partial [Deinococcus pimensis]|uniref:BTAD domain-containing putative transcriptional regulator n=1 Tax=Deinococcus pimensis TaxID=309888 RepID=UPI0005EB883C